ncbi:protein of unknown function [Paraburkholderia dioscoreae]|uniref:Uncharacterized protein n=1 Tax=Paraburkholderia dioscoreae TaxID=2604047 RepID=A0A5Q4ZH47_9BURK|nr:protein of unknown function [Paraburkholderia dioscoreae]
MAAQSVLEPCVVLAERETNPWGMDFAEGNGPTFWSRLCLPSLLHPRQPTNSTPFRTHRAPPMQVVIR